MLLQIDGQSLFLALVSKPKLNYGGAMQHVFNFRL